MKFNRLPAGGVLYSQAQNALRSDAVAASFLHVHQQLGALALGTTPSNNQTVTLDINSTNVVFNAVTGTPTNPGDVKAPGTAAGFVANLYAALISPTVSTSTFVALSAPNAQLVQYLGFALPAGATTITPFSLNTSTSSPLTSFNASTTVTSGSWTAQTMQLYVQPGTYYVGTTRVLFLGGSTPTITAPSSHPRIDLVTADSSGTIAMVTGTENASPTAPSYPANKLVLAEIYNVVGETALYDNDNQQSGQGYVYNDVRPAMVPAYISSQTQLASGVAILDPGSEAQGDILYYSGSAWVLLAPGSNGAFLQTKGSSANPQWAFPTLSSFGFRTTASTASGSLTSINYSGAGLDNLSEWDATNHQIAVANAGVYIVTACIMIEGGSNTTRGLLQIVQNSTTLATGNGESFFATDGNDNRQIIVTAMVNAAANDKIKIQSERAAGNGNVGAGSTDDWLNWYRIA